MGFHAEITDKQASLIQKAAMFFIASANPKMENSPKGEGPVNVSPKGGTKLHIIDRSTVAYLDYPGSGNETANHIAANGPVTLMVMSTEPENAGIVRLYGQGHVEPQDSDLAKTVMGDPAEHLANKPRQVFVVKVDNTQSSCGYGVPVMEFVAERTKEQRGRDYRD